MFRSSFNKSGCFCKSCGEFVGFRNTRCKQITHFSGKILRQRSIKQIHTYAQTLLETNCSRLLAHRSFDLTLITFRFGLLKSLQLFVQLFIFLFQFSVFPFQFLVLSFDLLVSLTITKCFNSFIQVFISGLEQGLFREFYLQRLGLT